MANPSKQETGGLVNSCHTSNGLPQQQGLYGHLQYRTDLQSAKPVITSEYALMGFV